MRNEETIGRVIDQCLRSVKASPRLLTGDSGSSAVLETLLEGPSPFETAAAAVFPLTSDPTQAYFRHASYLHARLHVTLQPNVNFVFVSRLHCRPPNQSTDW